MALTVFEILPNIDHDTVKARISSVENSQAVRLSQRGRALKILGGTFWEIRGLRLVRRDDL
ncbi:MAG: hypothetical protein IPG67_17130 [Acidobacteria bacterium]|nr:hypothetical protein [Acidobacteriota bacterium]